MKKTYYLIIFLIFAGAVFTVNAQNRHIFIDGTARRADHLSFFLDNFRMEAGSCGYVVADSEDEAGYTFFFEVVPNMIVYDDGTSEQAPPDEPQYLIQITFFSNTEHIELVSYDFPFTSLAEMYSYNQYLFLKAVVLIPPIDESEFIVAGSDSWQNKWIYARASIDFPIDFYKLKPTGLIGGSGIYDADPPSQVAPLDQVVIALPAITLGAEGQFLDFLAAGLKLQIGWLHLNDINLLNMAAGLDIMFPLKFIKNVTLEPYVSAVLPLFFKNSPISFIKSSRVFDSFSKFGIGAGFQIGVKGGPAGIIFADFNFMYYVGDAVRKNPYGPLYPLPPVIHYQRSVIGMGVGYKYGFIDRNAKKVKAQPEIAEDL